ncbi:MAG: DUF5590 domain-containing protein [Bacillaceae bacterium]|nr:DUF5590 domain-containing protein [Bacillaceae bacterium]
MKKVLIITSVIMILIVGQALHLYLSVQADKRDMEEKGRLFAINEASFQHVDQVSTYHGTESYLVIEGTDSANREVILWKGENSQEQVLKSRVVPREDILKKITKQYETETIIHITPGLDQHEKFWEVVFLDPEHKLHYLYFDLFNGNLIRSYRLHPITSD